MRRVLCGLACLAASLLACASVWAQGSLEQAVAARFPLTKATADRTDIVTAGSVMVLKKDGLLMNAIDANVKAQETYKDGHIQVSTLTKMGTFGLIGHGTAGGVVHRSFVAGEKLWLIDVQTVSDGVVLQLLSDALNDVRYTAFLKFPFAKGQPSSADQVVGQISQVMESQGGSDRGSAPAAPAASAPPPAPMAAIPPPPPPPDQPAAPPPTLEKGQTKAQVVAMFGQPVRVVKMGAKEIDYYKDMKVTYTNNKVSNVE